MGEWIETLDADIEWDISAHPLPDFPGRGSGRDAFANDMGNYLSGWTDSNMMLDRDLPTVWAVRDGRAVRLRVFKTRRVDSQLAPDVGGLELAAVSLPVDRHGLARAPCALHGGRLRSQS